MSRRTNHWGRFVEACLGGARTTAGFDYSGPLAEAVLLGTVALRFPQTTLQWNAAALAFDESDGQPLYPPPIPRWLGRQGTFLTVIGRDASPRRPYRGRSAGVLPA